MKKGYRTEHPLFVAAGLQFEAYTLAKFSLTLPLRIPPFHKSLVTNYFFVIFINKQYNQSFMKTFIIVICIFGLGTWFLVSSLTSSYEQSQNSKNEAINTVLQQIK